MREVNEKKSACRGLRSSLALRVLLIETILLVVPLLCFAGLMYYEDSRIKAKENQFSLELIVEGKAAEFNHFIQTERAFLKMMGASDLAQNQLDHEETFHLFRVSKQGNRLICDRSTHSSDIGKDFTYLLESKGESFFKSPQNEGFYVVETVSNGLFFWVRVIPPKSVKEMLAVKVKEAHFVHLSLLSNKSKVVFSTRDEWQDQTVRHHRLFYIGSNTLMGEAAPLSGSALTLLATTPDDMYFVDISYFLAKMMGLLGVILIVGGGATFYLTFRLGKPLVKLQNAMQRVESSDLKARYRVDRMGFEINRIGESFNQMVDSLEANIERIKQTEAEKKAVERELMIGQKVQTSLLPKELPSFPGLTVATHFSSAKEVGGDFYDFLVRKEKLFFSIADTAGKGISACLYSLSVRSMLRSFSEVSGDLATILKETNNLFCLDTGDSGVFVTAWAAFYDPKKKELHYASCGHFPAYLMRLDGTIEKLTTKGMAFGVETFDKVATSSCTLKKGELLLLYTDGIVEAESSEMELFGEKRLEASLMTIGKQNAEEVVAGLVQEVTEFSKKNAQQDDMTLLALKVS